MTSHTDSIQELHTKIRQQDALIRQLTAENKALTLRLRQLEQPDVPLVAEAPLTADASSYDTASYSDQQVLTRLTAQNGGRPFSHEQLAALRFNMKTHLRIIAAAGSGKTQTICGKAAYLVLQEHVDPKQIMMCTFSKKARDEMAERVTSYLQHDGSIQVRTFHSWFGSEYLYLLRRFPELNKSGLIGEINEEKYQQTVSRLIGKYNLYQFNRHEDRSIQERLSYWRNMGFSDREILQFIARFFDKEELVPNDRLSTVFGQFLTELQRIKEQEGFMNFDDMMLNLKQLLETNDTILQAVQRKYRYIFIDEFQDINPIQKQVIELICPPDSNSDEDSPVKLVIVGDDDQSIYFFRGAEPHYIKQFDQEYQQTTLSLLTNYRSNQAIVTAGNRLIRHNGTQRLEKQMRAFDTNSAACQLLGFSDEEKEADWIAAKLQQVAAADGSKKEPDYTQTMVLYPSKLQLRPLLNALENKKIPYVTQPTAELLGLFGIAPLQTFFKKLIQLGYSQDPLQKQTLLGELIQQYSFCHFVKFSSSAAFVQALFAKNTPLKSSEIAAALAKERRLSSEEQKQAVRFFNQLILLAAKNELDPAALMTALGQTPKLKSELAKEEAVWLRQEAQQLKDWAGLSAAYQQAVDRIQHMKEHLKAYEAGELNAAYLLTIHASKGLGAKNVFVKGLYENALPAYHSVSSKSVDLVRLQQQAQPPTTLEEQRRLLYVAITRAKRNLYLTYPQRVGEKSVKCSSFLKETGLKAAAKTVDPAAL